MLDPELHQVDEVGPAAEEAGAGVDRGHGGRGVGRALVGERLHATLGDRRDDVHVGAAAAEVAAHALADLGRVELDALGPRLLEHARRRAELARRAVAALERVVLDERRLQRVQGAVRAGQPLDGRDLRAVVRRRPAPGRRSRGGRRAARCTTPHCPWSQPFLAPIEPEVLAQRVEQRRPGVERQTAFGAVDVQGDLGVHAAPRTPTCLDAAMADEREHDIVVLGATGFTGALTAEHLARHAPPGARWAIAGRTQGKLEAVRERLGADCGLVVADTSDPASLRSLAEGTRVLITTVGPYIELGEPVVAACAAAGTHYLDLTGEPEFMDLMYVRHHAEAVRTGARLLHACGFDSVPHDLGARFTVLQLPEGVPLEVEGYVRAGAMASGGTIASAMLIMARMRHAASAARQRRAMEPPAGGRRVRLRTGPPKRAEGFYLLPAPTIDPLIVRASALALDRYGPDFTYAHYVAARGLPAAAGMAAGVPVLAGLAQLPPARRLVSSRFPQGSGPSEERRARSWFKVRFVGTGGGKRVVCEVAGGDPGYTETSKMLAEGALALAFDDVPPVAGQVTTAQAMGETLTARLQAQGITFSVLG